MQYEHIAEHISKICKDLKDAKAFEDALAFESDLKLLRRSVRELLEHIRQEREDGAFFEGELDNVKQVKQTPEAHVVWIEEKDDGCENVEAFKKRRKKRLDSKAVERFRNRRQARLDADDEESSGGSHGNTKIPFGLCQREGIEVQSGWTPTDAWKALEGKGYDVKSVYKELKETGKVTSGKRESAETEEKPKASRDEAFKSKFDAYSKAKSEVADLKFEIDSTAPKMYKFLQDFIDEDEETLRGIEDEIKKGIGRKEKDRFREETEKLGDEIGELYEKYKSIDKELREMRKREHSDEEYEALIGQKIEVKNRREEAESDYYKRHELLKKIDDADALKRKIERKRGEIEEYKERHAIANEKIAAAQKAMKDRLAECKEYSSMDWDDCKTGEEVEMKAALLSDGGDKGSTVVSNVAHTLNTKGVAYKKPEKRVEPISEEEIIAEISGGDKTFGSCASVALAYVANKAGYKASDYRGGESQSAFSIWVSGIVADNGGEHKDGDDEVAVAKSLLDKMEDGKEYYLVAGRHASIVRKNGEKHEYLELQSEDDNGWKLLEEGTLSRRFGCETKTGDNFSLGADIIEVGKLAENDGVMSLVGFINTEAGEQKRGVGGHEK